MVMHPFYALITRLECGVQSLIKDQEDYTYVQAIIAPCAVLSKGSRDRL
jgi:hypothetical protein